MRGVSNNLVRCVMKEEGVGETNRPMVSMEM